MNRQFYDCTGKTFEEVQRWAEVGLIHKDDLGRVMDHWIYSTQTGQPHDIEYRLRRADGVFRWFHVRGLPSRNASGRIVRWYYLFTDIEDRKIAEQAVQASEHNFRLIVDSIPGLVSMLNAEGGVELVNRQIRDYTGLTLEELKDWRPVVHRDDLDLTMNQWTRSVESGQPLDIEVRLRRADGIYRWFHARAMPVRDTGGQIARWYTLLSDIEDRKTAEQALRASERDLGLIIETIPALVWSAAPDGQLTYVNKRVLDYTGTTLDALAQAGWVNFLHPDDVEPTVRAWSHAVGTGQQHEVQYRLRRSDGSYRWFQVLGQPARDFEGQMTRWYGLLIDIEDRKNAEEVLRNTQARLSRASQIATVGELAASIAHEVNQPLSAVVSNGHACLRWLLADPPNMVKAQQAAERIVRDGKDAGEVVRRIRSLFKRAPLEKIAIDLNEIIGEVLDVLRGEIARKHVAAEIDLEGELNPVIGDRVQLQQLVLNLLLNGIEAMDPIVDRPKKIYVRSRKQSPQVALLEIRDCGVGIKDPDKVFEAFFTTKENGMGMGLAICRSIVEAHEGRLWATSAEGCGTTFSITLPLVASAAQ